MLRRRLVLASIALLVALMGVTAFVSMRPVTANALHGCTVLTNVLSRQWS